MKKMSNYIMRILKNNFNVFASWAPHNYCSIEDENKEGLSFDVDGYLFKGKITIIYNQGNDLFDVYIGKVKYSEIYFDQLVQFIDFKVEKNCSDEEYNKRNEEFYKDCEIYKNIDFLNNSESITFFDI